MTDAVEGRPGPAAPGAAAYPPRVLVLTNPRIGRLHGGVADLLRAHLPESASVVSIEGPAAMTDRARRAAEDGFERVVAAGGDGTVGHILRALMHSGIPIGIVPLGTYNNFASSLGIPTDLAQACSIAVTGEAAAVDLGRVTARQPPTSFVFKEAVGVGVDALAFGGGLDVAGPAKIPVGALSLLSAMISFRPHPVRFRVDRSPHAIRCTQLIVANTPRYGPALPVMPGACPTDGVFHVRARTWRGRLDLLREVAKLFRGRPGDLEADIFRQAIRVDVKGSPHLLLHADGEFFCRLPATVEMLPGAVRIALPPKPP